MLSLITDVLLPLHISCWTSVTRWADPYIAGGQRSKNRKLLCTNISSQSALKTNALQKTPHLLIINCFLCVHLENICIISIWHIFAQTRHPIDLIWNVCLAFLIYLFFSVSVLCLSCIWLYFRWMLEQGDNKPHTFEIKGRWKHVNKKTFYRP